MSENNQDLKELENLFIANHKALCNLAYKILRDKSAGEDVVQDVFLRMWRNREKIKIESTLKGYLFKAVANGALDELQKSKKLQFTESLQEGTTSVDHAPTDPVSEEIIQSKIKEALDRLPDRCRTIFVLSRYEGLKHKEIAEALNISLNTVETQIRIALDKLRKDLKPLISGERIFSSIHLLLIIIGL